MKAIPSIDLLEGQVVRLRQGRYDDCTVYAADPVALAGEWSEHAEWLHIVDLEGARDGRPVQKPAIRSLVASFRGRVQVGGGVRSLAVIEEYLELGVERVVVGTAAITEPQLVEEASKRFPGKVVVALDAKSGFVATAGWMNVSTQRATEVVQRLAGLALAAVLYTDIERDGTEVGPNIAATRALAEACHVPVLASGGVGTLEHLRLLAKASAEAAGRIEGAIIGRALHEQRFTLQQAALAAAP